jgi:D-serine deaminase-like pyridoxal phosphate-dependent protein
MPLSLPPIAVPGQQVTDVQTPALLVDLDAFESNVQQMAALVQRHGVALRPHAKAHKSTAISVAQITAGATGICCQKLSEAYPFVNAGIRDVHISNQFVGSAKMAMAVELARHARLSVCVDHHVQVDELGKAAAEAEVTITLLPEVDVGHGRCGVNNEAALLSLVEKIASHTRLRFGGIQAYHGGTQHLPDWEGRKQAASKAAKLTAHYVRYLANHGIACPVVTGGGTGTAEFDAASGVYTELQPGSYVFMDAHYGSNAWEGDLCFQQSLFIASTIMSTVKIGQAVCDVGLKSVAVDSGLPHIKAEPHIAHFRYIAANDEHGILQTDADHAHVYPDPLGQRVLLIPGHCDPTCNLHRQYVGVRNGVVEAVWEIDARGLSQ